MPQRIQSPSSINTYKQCPRKYYYRYVLGLETLPSIHLARGKIAHSVLEDFFDLQPNGLSFATYQDVLKQRLQQLLINKWHTSAELDKLMLSKEQKQMYFEETVFMLLNWFEHFSERLQQLQTTLPEFNQAFEAITPRREESFVSTQYNVRGFIDAIEELHDTVRLMDYKTSKQAKISEEYRVQLAIYALLFHEKHGKKPDHVGIYFLRDPKHREITLAVDNELLKLAKLEIELIHLNTESSKIQDYPMKQSPLCKWSTGQCDHYDYCFNQKKVHDF